MATLNLIFGQRNTRRPSENVLQTRTETGIVQSRLKGAPVARYDLELQAATQTERDLLKAFWEARNGAHESFSFSPPDAERRSGLEVDSGTTTTLTDSALTEADDYWNAGLVKFTSGALQGTLVGISDFDAASDTVTFDETLGSAPSNGDTYDIRTGGTFRFVAGSYSEQKLAGQLWSIRVSVVEVL